MINKYICIVALLITLNMNGMDQETEKQTIDSSMKKIESWKDIQEFAHRIVAYRVIKNNVRAERGCKINGIHMGYILEKPEPAGFKNEDNVYGMATLINPTEMYMTYHFTDAIIKHDSPYMRLATEEEKKEIFTLLENNQAVFDYMFYYKSKIYPLLPLPETTKQ